MHALGQRATILFMMATMLLMLAAPRRAHAGSDTMVTAAVVTGGIVVGAAAIALVVTAVDRYSPPIFTMLPDRRFDERQRRQGRLRFGSRCSTGDGNLPIACW